MGTVITFYSYKGGVGRTMALANAAVLLAQRGLKVLMVDWDLDAPGLEFYFKTYLDLNFTAQRDGIIDLLYSHLQNGQGKSGVLEWQNLKIAINLERKRTIDFISAGSRKESGKEYFKKVRDLDVAGFYTDYKGGLFIEKLRNEWKQQYDFVLIDSRTGITDIGGICTIQFPDILILQFTANQQSVEGVVDVAMKATRARNTLPFDRFSLISVPIPSRFDTQAEFKISQKWLDVFAQEFKDIYANWLSRKVKVRRMLEITKIPYISYFSYDEKLPVIEQGTTDPAGLGYAYDTLASLIANNFEEADKLLEDRGIFVRDSQEEEADLSIKDELAADFAEGAGELELGNWTSAKRAFARVIKRQPDYERNEQLAATLLARAIVGEKSSNVPTTRISGKTALVLSGGGAKGAFQFMAEKYAREVKGYEWDIIAGVSVGALNGLMLAMEKYQRLEEIWQTISNDKVYTGKFNFWGIARLIFGAKSILGNEPLRKMIEQELDLESIRTDLRVGAVSLQTGRYKRFVPTDPRFEKGVLASTAIPIIWPPEDVSPAYPSMVDGGVRNVSPLGDVLDSDPAEVVIINCNRQTPSRTDKPFKNALDIGNAALEIALNEIFITDVREFIQINRNVEEAAERGVNLHKEDGTEFKFYKYSLIEPDEPLGDTLDFSSAAIKRSMEAGWEKAKQVLG